MHLHDLTIKKFSDGLKKKEFKVFEIVEAYFDLIEKQHKEIGAYLSLSKETAMRGAEEADIAIAKGENISGLLGVPFAIKDNILIEGEYTTAGSKILENYIAPYDASVIKKLKAEKAVFLGKTNLDEFAMGSSTENSAFEVTRNPHDNTRVAGGSSGGSVAAVAGNLALAALGSDTGGSIRQPAGFCGVVGLKTTYGVVSRFGLIALASSLDQIGPIAKTVEDAALVFKAISGEDRYDSTSSEKSAYGDELLNPKFEDIRKLKVGLPEEYFSEKLEPEVQKGIESAIQTFKDMGVEFKKINLPHTKYSVACYYIIMPAEASSNLARYDGIRYPSLRDSKTRARSNDPKKLLDLYINTRSLGFGEEVKRRIILGTFVLSSGYYDAYYSKAQKVRRLIKNDFDSTFKEVDVILAPTSPTRAFKIGEKAHDPLSMYLSDIFTIPANLAGLPAVSIPVKGVKGLPVGFQLIGKHFREADILGLGMFYEKM